MGRKGFDDWYNNISSDSRAEIKLGIAAIIDEYIEYNYR